MALVVPFDGSDLARAALVRAREFGAVFEEDVLAVSVVPRENEEYARECGWIGPDEPLDVDTVASEFERQVTETAPDARFRCEIVGRYASPGTIAKRVRTVAREADAPMVFIGSENAGRIVTSVSSVGGSIATDTAYDVVIVRHDTASRLAGLEDR